MSWLSKLLPPRVQADAEKANVPEGLWHKCAKCNEILYYTDLEQNLQVCPKCNHHHQLSARKRIDILLDTEGRSEIGAQVKPLDVLNFKDSKEYTRRLSDSTIKTKEDDALVVMHGTINQQKAVVAAFEFGFIGGSMGSVVGERFVRGVQAAADNSCPFICITASGGARMQEGLTSLMQMTKTAGVLHLLTRKSLPFISILTDPTMGGVSASFAFLGDVVIAEPGALIGFAGPRVIEQIVREKLAEGFQTAEFLLDKGAIDMVVPRKQLKSELSRILALLQNKAAS